MNANQEAFDWPEEVIEQAQNRNLVLIVGSGVSASVEKNGVRPPNWNGLLKSLAAGIGVGSRGEEIRGLLAQERMLDAAELLRQQARRLGKEQDFLQSVRSAVDGKPSNYFDGSEWHDAIVRIEPNLIVTTNYDKIIERATSGGYSTHTYSSPKIAGDIRRRIPTLIKMHGSVDSIEDIVFTRTDYTRLHLLGTHALDVLQALLLTRPALLIGYSLRDPDIQLLFENVFGGRNDVPAHYMLAQDSMPDYEVEILRYSYGINALTYATNHHDDALAALVGLGDIVQASKPS